MKPAIFCDFDGTITENDNIIAIMKEFAPEEWKQIAADVISTKISVQEGVGKLFTLLPSSKKQEITDFIVNAAQIRAGFKEFVEYCKQEEIPLYIISGGIDFFVYPILAEYVKQDQIFCNGSDFSGEHIVITWPHDCDTSCEGGCGLCKPSLIKKFAKENQPVIVIGDSVTDFKAARIADFVLARDHLLTKAIEENLPHHPFTTFFDCIEKIEEWKAVYR